MTIVRGWLNSAPDATGSQPAPWRRTDVRTRTQPGRRPATARIVGDWNSVLVLIVATTRPPGDARSWARRRTWNASGARNRGAGAAPAVVEAPAPVVAVRGPASGEAPRGVPARGWEGTRAAPPPAPPAPHAPAARAGPP